MKKRIKKLINRRRDKTADPQNTQPASENVPRITNETVAAHREEVLSSARKYIYPLQHSKHKIVLISTALFIVALVAFFTYTTLALYKFQDTSGFLYRVTQVLPFPVAKAGTRFVAYENYLFELRHYMHYYENQQELDFNSESGQQQLAEFKKRALNKVVNDAYIKQLAERNGIIVTDQEVEEQIAIVREQNRLGGSERVFEDVLQDFWGWSVDDFKRSLKLEMLEQKVLAELDTETKARAEQAMSELGGGADFADVAKKHSDDAATKDSGGEYGFLIDRVNRDIAAQTVDALFKLEPGQYSGVINVGYGLEIVKNLEQSGDKVRGAHILFNFKDIESFVNDLKEQEKARLYINP